MTSGFELTRLTAALKDDGHLRTELQGLAGDLDALRRWVEAKGFALAKPDLERLAASLGELSDEDLEEVAGGNDPWGGTPPKP